MKLPPSHTLLAILQQSEYDVAKTKAWVLEHYPNYPQLEPEQWTPKLKLIEKIFVSLGKNWAALRIAVQATTPIEYTIRRATYRRAQSKLQQLRANNTKVVVIAGSYAKTSTKQWLEHLLSGQITVAITPKSINTMLGIARWLLDDVTSSHQILVIELGEYKPGQLAELMAFVKPDWGIITPIGLQHLEMFSSVTELVKEFSSVIEWFSDHRQLEAVISNDKNYRYFTEHFPQLKYYGRESVSELKVSNTKVTRAGTEADLLVPTPHHVFTPILGHHQITNSLAAWWLAPKLGIAHEELKKRYATMPYIHRRHEPTFAANDVIILDNSYNTNASSIEESLQLLNQLEPSRRFIVTLGFTETGTEMAKLHRELGQLLVSYVDYVGLIEAPWTKYIIEGWSMAGGDPQRVRTAPSQTEAWQKLQELVVPKSVILFEGGYQEVYLRTGKDQDAS